MVIKLILFIIVLFTGLLYEYTKSKNKKLSKIIFIMLLLLLTAFFTVREFVFDDFGTDYTAYKQWFDIISFDNLILHLSNDGGFNFLIVLSKTIFNNFYVFLFICGFIINYSVLKYIDSNSNKIGLSIVIYFSFFYFNTFNIMRQWIACSIFLLAYSCIRDKKIIKYIIMCIIASLFHSSAIFLVLLYPIINMKKNTVKRIILVLIIGIVLFLNVDFIENNLLYSGSLSFLDSYTKYMNYGKGLNNYVYFSICMINMFILLFMSIKSKYNLNSNNNSIKIIYLSLAMVFSLISTKSFAFARFSTYFLPVIILTIPEILCFFEKKDRLIISFIIILLMLYIVIV